MGKEKHMAAHEAAAQILKNAEKQDSELHYLLITTHDDSMETTRSAAASKWSLTQMLAHIDPQILERALALALSSK